MLGLHRTAADIEPVDAALDASDWCLRKDRALLGRVHEDPLRYGIERGRLPVRSPAHAGARVHPGHRHAARRSQDRPPLRVETRGPVLFDEWRTPQKLAR